MTILAIIDYGLIVLFFLILVVLILVIGSSHQAS
jgi:hypothetical protein